MTLEQPEALARGLRRHKAYALAALLLAAACWGAAYAPGVRSDMAAWMRAVAEAAIIGGLADWFAVTALFRHPLGLPLPHTALIPTHRDRIADGIARYVGAEFLQRDMLLAQLRRLGLAERLGGLLRAPEHRERLVGVFMRMLPGLLRSRHDAALRNAVFRAIRRGLGDADLRAPLAALLRQIVDSREMGRLIEDACDATALLVHAKREVIVERFIAGSARWVPALVDRAIANRVTDGAIRLLQALKDPETTEGAAARAWIRDFARKVEQGEAGADGLVEGLRQALQSPALTALLASAWEAMRQSIERDLALPNSRTHAAIDGMLGALAEQLKDPALVREVDQRIEDLISLNVPVWREEIQRFIADTLCRQDAHAFARNVELRIGKDLQFIRINGTIMGGIVGALIHGLNLALGG